MCRITSTVGRSAWKKSSMLVNRSTTMYRLSVLTRQMAYARRNAANSIRSRMVKRVRGQGSGVRDQGSGVRGQESGVRGQGSGVRGQGSGGRGQGSGGRGQGAGVRGQGAGVSLLTPGP